jgi:hypothetical protein
LLPAAGFHAPDPTTINLKLEQVMRNVCRFPFGRALLFSGVLLLSGLVAPAMAEDETQACNPDGQAFAYGDVLNGCTIELVADLDIFTFAGSAGEDPRILLTRTVGTGTACAEIRGPDNSVVVANVCAANVLSPGPLPLSGIYQILVTEQANNQLFTFNISIERLFPLRSPTTLVFDQIITDREILPVADLDTFKFNATAGDEVRIILTRTVGVGLPCFELRAPDNATLVALTCSNIDLNPGPLPLTGVYQIIVTEQANNQLFTYNLSLTCVSGDCPDPPPVCLANPSFAGNTLTMDFVVGTPEPTEWHLAILALGRSFTLWKIQLPVIDPAVTASVPIVGFPAIGTVALLSTFTDSSGLVCTDLKTVDTGPMGAAVTPLQLRQYLEQDR